MRYFGQKLVQLIIVVVAVTFTVSLALAAIPNSVERSSRCKASTRTTKRFATRPSTN
jgi:Tfp pilus assembly protein PilE